MQKCNVFLAHTFVLRPRGCVRENVSYEACGNSEQFRHVFTDALGPHHRAETPVSCMPPPMVRFLEAIVLYLRFDHDGRSVQSAPSGLPQTTLELVILRRSHDVLHSLKGRAEAAAVEQHLSPHSEIRSHHAPRLCAVHVERIIAVIHDREWNPVHLGQPRRRTRTPPRMDLATDEIHLWMFFERTLDLGEPVGCHTHVVVRKCNDRSARVRNSGIPGVRQSLAWLEYVEPVLPSPDELVDDVARIVGGVVVDQNDFEARAVRRLARKTFERRTQHRSTIERAYDDGYVEIPSSFLHQHKQNDWLAFECAPAAAAIAPVGRLQVARRLLVSPACTLHLVRPSPCRIRTTTGSRTISKLWCHYSDTFPTPPLRHRASGSSEAAPASGSDSRPSFR